MRCGITHESNRALISKKVLDCKLGKDWTAGQAEYAAIKSNTNVSTFLFMKIIMRILVFPDKGRNNDEILKQKIHVNPSWD